MRVAYVCSVITEGYGGIGFIIYEVSMNVIYSLIVGYTFYKTFQSPQESPVTFE